MDSEVSSRHDAADKARHLMEAMIDEIVSESFPASDAPSWGAAGVRLRELEALVRKDPPPMQAGG